MELNLSTSEILELERLQRNVAGSPYYVTVTCVPMFFLPYSPNLNLIERLWKFFREKVINTGFYRIKGTFKKAIHDFFESIGNYREELESLLALNFRLINS